jgi:hypothetical protein
MPARKKPVMKRRMKSELPSCANMIRIFAIDATMLLAKKTFDGLNLSAMERKANTKVPAMNPSCTIDVRLLTA